MALIPRATTQVLTVALCAYVKHLQGWPPGAYCTDLAGVETPGYPSVDSDPTVSTGCERVGTVQASTTSWYLCAGILG